MRTSQEYTDDDHHHPYTLYEPETVEDVLELGVAFADDHAVTIPMMLLDDICRRIKALEER